MGSATVHGMLDYWKCQTTESQLYNDNFYKQQISVPVVGPMVDVMAELVIGYKEQSVLPSLQNNYKLFLRYVDDIFIICDNSTLANTLL